MRVRARAIDAAYSISAFLTAARQLDWSSSFPSVLHSEKFTFDNQIRIE